MSARAFRRASIPMAFGLLAVTTSLWAQSPIISQGGIGPSVEETGTTDPFPSPRFGASVAICGRIAMAGIPGDLATDPNEFGRVAVFEKRNAVWVRTATLIGTAEAGGTFGERMDIEGHRAVIGGPKAIYLFERRVSGWVQSAKVVLGSADTFFGRVDLDHDQIFTAVMHQSGDVTVNQVNVYALSSPGTLTRTAFIRPRYGLDDGDFGSSLQADGRLLVVGSPNNNGPGSAYVYSGSGRQWSKVDRLMASDASANDGFGTSVGVRDGVIVVGAPRADLNLPYEGTGPLLGNVYVFRHSPSGWYESQMINEPGMEDPQVGIGASVAIGRGLLALFQDDNRFPVQSAQRALVYDWVDGSFRFNRRVISSEEDRVADIDMAGRSLIVSVQRPPDIGIYYTLGSAGIWEFGPYQPTAP